METKELTSELSRQGIEYELLSHARTEHAADEAAALGVTERKVGKTLILKSGDRYVRAVLPASERLDLRRVREHLDDRELRLATEGELAEAYADFELGAVPPFGGRAGDRVLIDRRIAELDQVTLEAGTHVDSLTLRVRDLSTLTNAEVIDLCSE
ncbi:MAG TPA: YbaK/EbsC family protein [Gaiellaceae bacterium]|jgi:Ala-tRNA(Pro) deacylase